MKRHIALLVAGLLVSCGGGSDGDPGGTSGPAPATNPGAGGTVFASDSGGGAATVAAAAAHAEESDARVSLSGPWTNSDSSSGWSGGAALQSDVTGATASFSFTGTSVRWIGSRGRDMGIASVRIDGGPPMDVDLFGRPADEVRTPIITLGDLSDGPHTLTVEVTGRRNSEATSSTVVVDAFDVQPLATVSHWQDTDPDARFSGGWTKSSLSFPWSGNGVSNPPDLPVTAHETEAAGESVSLPFRGTGIGWVGYRGPDAGIATVQVDGGAPTEIDLYSPTAKFQALVFAAGGLPEASHTLKITATGRKNDASSAARVVVDAWDVMTPGRRYEESDSSIDYAGTWHHNDARVWSGGMSRTSNEPGATATFPFTGTSVTWIGCRKSSAGGTARVFIDGRFMQEVRLHESYPIEGYQKPVFRADGLSPGRHTLTIEVVDTGGSYVVVDAFDVR